MEQTRRDAVQQNIHKCKKRTKNASFMEQTRRDAVQQNIHKCKKRTKNASFNQHLM